MIVPIAIAAGVYGWYRFKKYQQAKELDALLPTPGTPAPLVVTPSQSNAIKTTAKIFGAMKTTPKPVSPGAARPGIDPPPGSAYGMYSPTFQAPPAPSYTPPAAPAPAPATGFATSGSAYGAASFNYKP